MAEAWDRVRPTARALSLPKRCQTALERLEGHLSMTLDPCVHPEPEDGFEPSTPCLQGRCDTFTERYTTQRSRMESRPGVTSRHPVQRARLTSQLTWLSKFSARSQVPGPLAIPDGEARVAYERADRYRPRRSDRRSSS